MDDSKKSNDNSKQWRPLVLIVFILGLGIGYVFDWNFNRNPEHSLDSEYPSDLDEYEYYQEDNAVQSSESATNHNMWKNFVGVWSYSFPIDLGPLANSTAYGLIVLQIKDNGFARAVVTKNLPMVPPEVLYELSGEIYMDGNVMGMRGTNAHFVLHDEYPRTIYTADGNKMTRE